MTIDTLSAIISIGYPNVCKWNNKKATIKLVIKLKTRLLPKYS